MKQFERITPDAQPNRETKMYNIKTLNNIRPRLSAFQQSVCRDEERAARRILVRSAAMQDMALPESLLALHGGAGVNNIPWTNAARQHRVFNTPGANANAVKELCWRLVLASRK